MKAIAGRWYRKVASPVWIDSAFMVVAVCWNDDNDGVEIHIRAKGKKAGRTSARVVIISPSQWKSLSERYAVMPGGWEPRWIKHWVYTPEDIEAARPKPPEEVRRVTSPSKGFIKLF